MAKCQRLLKKGNEENVQKSVHMVYGRPYAENTVAQKNKLLIKSYEPENNSNHTLF